jgi:hypothetical protein
LRKYSSQSLLVGAVLAFGLQQAVAADSGFIENMPKLSPDPDRAGVMIWEKPGLNRAAYTRVILEPITIFISPKSEYKGLKPDELKKMADIFREDVTRTLQPDIQVVDKGGPGVLYVRAALTDVKVAKKGRGLFGHTQIGFAVTEASGTTILLKDAVLEIEALDSANNERLFVLVDKAPKTATGKQITWDEVNKTFIYYAERLKARMRAAK